MKRVDEQIEPCQLRTMHPGMRYSYLHAAQFDRVWPIKPV